MIDVRSYIISVCEIAIGDELNHVRFRLFIAIGNLSKIYVFIYKNTQIKLALKSKMEALYHSNHRRQLNCKCDFTNKYKSSPI